MSFALTRASTRWRLIRTGRRRVPRRAKVSRAQPRDAAVPAAAPLRAAPRVRAAVRSRAGPRDRLDGEPELLHRAQALDLRVGADDLDDDAEPPPRAGRPFLVGDGAQLVEAAAEQERPFAAAPAHGDAEVLGQLAAL